MSATVGVLEGRSREVGAALCEDMAAADKHTSLDYLLHVEANEGEEGLARALAMFDLSNGPNYRRALEVLLPEAREKNSHD